MKRIIVATLIASSMMFACSGKNVAAEASSGDASEVSKSDASYAFGVAIGESIKQTAVELDYQQFLAGVKDVLEGKKTKMTPDEANTKIQSAITAAMVKKAAASAETEKKFFEENGKKDGIKTTASGLQYEVISEGTGAKPVATDQVKVHYVGTLIDGTKFDSSIDRGEPAVFALNQVIPGWTEAIQLMSVGSKYRFYIPSELAYGESGAGGVIGPNETLIFEVELLSIEDAAATSN